MRLTPTGMIVARLLREWRDVNARFSLLGEEISTPTVYQWGVANPAFDELTRAFSDRLFALDGRRSVLRHGADPGYFAYLRRLSLSARHLPLRLHETGAVFRRSQRGELRGLARLHEYDMLEHHTLCANLEDAAEEYRRQLAAQLELHRTWTSSTVAWFRVTRDTLPSALSIIEVTRLSGVPALVEILEQPTNYWAITHTLYTRGRLRTFNSQIDLVNARRFGVKVRGAEGPLAIIHTSLGSTERLMLVAVDEGMSSPDTDLPLWLAPVQLRFIPVAPQHLQQATRLAEAAVRAGVRADIDDRSSSVGRRIRDAMVEWVPYVVVVGDSTSADERMQIRRRKGSPIELRLDQVVARIGADCRGFPTTQLGHLFVSRRTPAAN
jgi:threonyl-tRNA synthetase